MSARPNGFMDDQRDSYVRWREGDRLYVTCQRHADEESRKNPLMNIQDGPNTPRVVLELDGCPTVWTKPEIHDYILSHLWRLISEEFHEHDDRNESDSSNDINQPCWLRWSPTPIDPALDDFIVLHHDPDSKIHQRIGVEEQPTYQPSRILHMLPNKPHSPWTKEAKETVTPRLTHS